MNMPMFLYRNETREQFPDHHYLKVVLKGLPGNTDAIGSKVTVRHRGQLFYLEQMPMRGFKSTVDPRPNLGVGNLTMVDTLMVQWPDGRVTLMKDVPTDQTLTLLQEEASFPDPVSVQELTVTDSFRVDHHYFREVTRGVTTGYVHRENEFDDFKRDRLIYHMLSTEGPGVCMADVNGDGLEDLFAGGAKEQPGTLLIQQPGGWFRSAGEDLFAPDAISEDTDAAFFDADGDGDMDLYVARGGNEYPTTSSALVDRLYLNDGHGNFTRSDQVLPAGRYESTACVRPADFDGDGVTELFVGIRLRPFLYGVPVNGYLLENDGSGQFTNVTPGVAPGLQEVGMIRDMRWEDLDGDGDLDMVLAGDWMPVRIFLQENGRFTEKKEAFGEPTAGWWNCLVTADVDGDGDPDLVAGNHGLNSRFRASRERPVTMVVNDFDLNGSAEQIISVYEGDSAYPLALKHDLTSQIPRLAQKYPRYSMYKNQQVSDIFAPNQLKNALFLEASMLETSLFLNDGSGSFTRRPLPPEVQFSTVMAIRAGDYDGDGLTDLLMGGNLFRVKPEVGRYDASYGWFLKGDGKGKFRNIPPGESGWHLEGEVRRIIEMEIGGETHLVVAGNNAPFQFFRPVKKSGPQK